MTAQELREKYCKRYAIIVKAVLTAEHYILDDPKVLQRVKDKRITADEYVRLIVEEVTRYVRDEEIANFFGEELADETEQQQKQQTP